MIGFVMNTIDRSDITPDVTEWNVSSAGVDMTTIITDNGSIEKEVKDWAAKFADVFIDNGHNIGNPQALNNGLDIAKGIGCDYFVIAGNDIKMPENWVRYGIELLQHPNVDLVGFGGDGERLGDINGKDVVRHPVGTTGSWVMSKETLNRYGYFATFSKYGYWDGDYCNRIRAAKRLDVYLPHLKVEDLGVDDGQDSEYRRFKNSEAKKAWPHIVRLSKSYNEERHYLNRNNELR